LETKAQSNLYWYLFLLAEPDSFDSFYPHLHCP
jgi:hypothetical protein